MIRYWLNLIRYKRHLFKKSINPETRQYHYYYCDLKCFLTNTKWCNEQSKRAGTATGRFPRSPKEQSIPKG